MEYGEIFGNVDLALIALYAFWIFFAVLVVYLQIENMREGYPLISEVTGRPLTKAPPLSTPKTFTLAHGRGQVTVGSRDTREVKAELMGGSLGSAFVPTGDPMVDGLGPAAWAERADHPDFDLHGRPKIVPMRSDASYSVPNLRRDPRGWPVVSGDEQVVGTVADLWIDRPELCVRFIEIDLAAGGKRLAPMGLVRLGGRNVHIDALYAGQFAGVPQTKAQDQVTLLEEERISAYYCGGKLYASRDRQEPLI